VPFSAADLPIDDGGRVYHLQAKPEQIAADILLVGDPGRAKFIGARFLRDVEFHHEHRGLVTITGTAEISGGQAPSASPLRVTVVTSGMGTPSLEIVASELVALNEIDVQTRTRKSDYPRLHVLRVGTSGGLQASTELGTPIITTWAIGLDNTGLFYEAPYPGPVCERLEGELPGLIDASMRPGSRFRGKIRPYVARAEPTLVAALVAAATRLGVPVKRGLTVSAPGFFLPQGRDIARIGPSAPDLDAVFAQYDPKVEDLRVENMEMESSFLIHYLSGLGHWAGAICPAIANRRRETFDAHYQAAIERAIQVALLALASVRNGGD
jgi:uridine phosphorylase